MEFATAIKIMMVASIPYSEGVSKRANTKPTKKVIDVYKRQLQTHYHADHAQGLLHLRWGQGLVIPVHGPDDPEGLADLYKHPGILDFSQPFMALERRQLGELKVTALPLTHSRPTFGYLFEGKGFEGQGRRCLLYTSRCV